MSVAERKGRPIHELLREYAALHDTSPPLCSAPSQNAAGNILCICGHADNRHADGGNPLAWGTGKCELCNCTRFEPHLPNAKADFCERSEAE